jgi:hypothetical protein
MSSSTPTCRVLATWALERASAAPMDWSVVGRPPRFPFVTGARGRSHTESHVVGPLLGALRSVGIVGIALGVMIGLAVFVPVARAGSVKETARAEWERASVEYTLGHFEAAARAYEDAYRLVPDPALLFNLGQARRHAGGAEAAISAYRSFLRLSRPDAPDRGIAEKRVQELEASVAASTPGRATVNLALPASEGSTSPVLLSPPPVDDARRPKWWLWSAAGAVVVAAGVAVLVVLVRSQQDVISGRNGTASRRRSRARASSRIRGRPMRPTPARATRLPLATAPTRSHRMVPRPTRPRSMSLTPAPPRCS